jgi:oligoribonuclease NrnB/cAMP/cGMP phosphodiesterase (DHH superfamily)
MRIVTRPDFDGVVCAVLLYDAENVKESVKWVEPSDMQKGLVDIKEGDIIANLPYNENCALWFDHHYSNRINKPFNGSFRIAPSAAGIIFEYYKHKLKRDYSKLIRETDKIDAADLSLDEVLSPENHPYVLLSMTVSGRRKSDEPYWNKLIDLLRKYEINEVLDDPEVKERCNIVIRNNKNYKTFLTQYTQLKEHVSITDFRVLDRAPDGNRFLVYSMFPESVVNIKIAYDDEDREKVIVKVGHSIFNKNCNVNVGQMLSRFEGGGHRGAGACRFHISKADDYIPKILDILLKNKADEN